MITAARVKREQLEAFENTDDISINPASTPSQTGAEVLTPCAPCV